MSSSVTVSSITFNPGASAFIIDTGIYALTIKGTGIVNNSGITEQIFVSAGDVIFAEQASAGNATITNYGSRSYDDGSTTFRNSSTAGDATIINEGGINPGNTIFQNTANAGYATIITNGGTGGKMGGFTLFEGPSDGGYARAITNGNGFFDISGLTKAGMGIGSIAGSGDYFLGGKTLTVGGNGLSTTVSGFILDGGKYGGVGGTITKVGMGTLTLTGINTYSGGTNFNGGTLAVNQDANLGTGPLSFDGGTLEALAAGSGVVSSKAITLKVGGGTFSADAGTVSTLSGVISGIGSLTKIGTGTLVLTGINAYNGGTKIDGGILAANNDVNLGTGNISFNGGTLEALAGGGGITSGKSITLNALGGTFLGDTGTQSALSGAISGTGSLVKTGAGLLILSGMNSYSGGTKISDGTLQAGSATGLSANSDFPVNSILDLNGFNSTIGSLSGPGTVLSSVAGTVTLAVGNDNGSSTFGGAIEDGSGVLQLTKSGTGTLTLTGTDIYMGGTAINSGTLQLGNGGTTGSIVGNVTDNGTLAFDRSDSVTFDGIISGKGNVVNLGTGTLILTGTNTYTGGITISGGTLQVGNGGITGSIAGNVVDNGTLAFNRSDAITFGGVIRGTGDVVKLGAGTLTLTNANT